MNLAASPLASVARELTEIIHLHEALLGQAIHKATHLGRGVWVRGGEELPGGDALVALGPVASREAWENMQQTSERTGQPLTAPDLEGEIETPLETVLYWSERWRRHHGAEYGQTPTIGTEVNFIRWNLEWAIEHEPEWGRFVDDIRSARVRLENIVHDGQRDIISDDVTCLLCDTPLRRRMTHADGYEDEWWCRDCGMHLTTAQFNLAASEAARRELGLS